jgi:hypothetical protein
MHTFKSDLILFSAGIAAVLSVVGFEATGLSGLVATLLG